MLFVATSPGGSDRAESKGLAAKRMKHLPWSYLLSYAAPMIGAGGMNFTLTTFAAYFYTDVMGVSAGKSNF